MKLAVLNASSQEGAASAALVELTKLGFRGAGEGNDKRGTVEQTEIRYQPGAQDKARTVFKYVRPDARLVEDENLKGADVALVIGKNFSSIQKPNSEPITTSTAPGASTTGAPSTAAPASGTPSTSTPPTTKTPPASAGGTAAPIFNESQLGAPAPKQPPC